MPPKASPREIEELYHSEGKSLREIAELLGFADHTSVLKIMRRYGIPRRRRSEANRLQIQKEQIRLEPGTDWPRRRRMDEAPWLRCKSYLIFGDLHCPFYDERAVEVLCQVIEDHKPDVVVENGDGLDFYQFSKFDKSPLDGCHLEEERDAHARVAKAIRDAMGPRAWYVYLGGPDDNHLYRLIRFIHANPGLTGYHALEPEYILALDEYDGEYVEGPLWLHGSFVVCHARRVGTSNRCSQFSAYTARKLADTFQASGVTAHTHRLGLYSYNPGSPHQPEIYFAEGGCMCRLDPEYCPSPNWQQGATYVTFFNGQPWLEFVSIRGGQTIFRGKEYSTSSP